MKNLFIPHQANDYKPSILHPKRLLFHGLSAVFIKLIIFVAILGLPATAWLSPDVLKDESRKIISLTNNIRVEKNLNTLNENSLLNQAAVNKVQDMMVQQYFAHVSPKNKNMLSWLAGVGYNSAASGENLAMGFSSAESVVKAWTKSTTHYANLIDPDYKEIGVAMISGTFENKDSNLVAQYLATPKVIEKIEPENPIKAEADEVLNDDNVACYTGVTLNVWL